MANTGNEWTDQELKAIGDAEELRISSLRVDGSLRAEVPIWVVRVGNELVIRSHRGAAGGWYRHAVAAGRGHIAAGGLDRNVTFEPADPFLAPAIDAVFRSKYARHGDSYVLPMVAQAAVKAALKILPIN